MVLSENEGSPEGRSRRFLLEGDSTLIPRQMYDAVVGHGYPHFCVGFVLYSCPRSSLGGSAAPRPIFHCDLSSKARVRYSCHMAGKAVSLTTNIVFPMHQMLLFDSQQLYVLISRDRNLLLVHHAGCCLRVSPAGNIAYAKL